MSHTARPAAGAGTTEHNSRTTGSARSARLKALGLLAGAAAVLAAVAFSLAQPDGTVEPGGHGALVAGGNHNPTFAPPAVPGMDMGATVTETTPSSALPIEKAVPAVKAGH